MNKFLLFLISVGLITIIFGTIYVAGQQILRQGANDPQIQMAEDGFVPSFWDHIDIAKSLAPFVIHYEETRKPYEGNGYLDNQLAQLPGGVFDYVDQHGEDRITWEAKPGVRIAAVITKTMAGTYTLAGRSLREVEVRELKLMEMVGLAWIVVIIGISIGIFVLPWRKK